jgi:hypothetical protein
MDIPSDAQRGAARLSHSQHPSHAQGLQVGTNLKGLNTETTKQPTPYTAVTERFEILERVTALAAICM